MESGEDEELGSYESELVSQSSLSRGDITLTAAGVARYARNAGVPCGTALRRAVCVAYGESTWVTGAVSSTNDHGLWQINRTYWGASGWTCDIYSPACNAKYMADISDDGSNWQPWHAYGGSLYNTCMNKGWGTQGEAKVCKCSSYSGRFSDDEGSVHENNINKLTGTYAVNAGGCGTASCPNFCPKEVVSRADMAMFLSQAKKLPSTTTDYFTDDEGQANEGHINRIAKAGYTSGCNPPANTKFCPNDGVTRGQMAAFLVRAFNLPNTSKDYFIDDEGNTFESAINRVAAAGVTLGCNPPTNNRYCPNDPVTREQMATFLIRALE